MQSISQVRRALAKALDTLEDVAHDRKAYAAQEKVVAGLERQLGEMEAKMRARARTVRDAGSNGVNTEEQFANLGEQLHAIARAAHGGHADPRLVRAPQGMNEGSPADGGFPVQVDFSSTIMSRVYEMGEIASRVTRIPVSASANGVKIPGVDETSRVDGSRYGGVQSYWISEGAAATASRPKFRTIDLDLKKLGVLWYVTDELMQDAASLTAIAEQAFSEEITFKVENAIVRGTGAGQPLGYTASGAKVSVAKEGSQAANTILFANIVNMWARLYARSQQNAVWLINQNTVPQLLSLAGPAGATVPTLIYMPPGGLSQAPYGTLLGRPVIPVEYCETLGTEGDIQLVDLSQYAVAEKGGAQQESSIHVAFTTAETAFRIMYRVDGQPLWNSALTPFKGTPTLSPYITLATRA